MVMLKWLGWGSLGLAGLIVFAAFAAEELFFIAPAFAAAVSGVLFLAIELIIQRLTEIRDAVQPVPSVPETQDDAPQARSPEVKAPIATGALGDLEKRIAAAKSKQ